MESNYAKARLNHMLQLDWVNRWSVYARLRELSIPCRCEAGKPLQVDISSPLAAIQIWSVTRQFTLSRSQQLAWLTHCWNQ